MRTGLRENTQLGFLIREQGLRRRYLLVLCLASPLDDVSVTKAYVEELFLTFVEETSHFQLLSGTYWTCSGLADLEAERDFWVVEGLAQCELHNMLFIDDFVDYERNTWGRDVITRSDIRKKVPPIYAI
jgi:hypothetical protein